MHCDRSGGISDGKSDQQQLVLGIAGRSGPPHGPDCKKILHPADLSREFEIPRGAIARVTKMTKISINHAVCGPMHLWVVDINIRPNARLSAPSARARLDGGPQLLDGAGMAAPDGLAGAGIVAWSEIDSDVLTMCFVGPRLNVRGKQSTDRGGTPMSVSRPVPEEGSRHLPAPYRSWARSSIATKP